MTGLPGSGVGLPPAAVTTLAIEIARLQAPVGTSNRFVKIVLLEDETLATLDVVELMDIVKAHCDPVAR